MMNSSAGFKKRPLLRPPSGMLQQSKQLLKVIDINQSDAIIATSIKAEVAAIQDQINTLDNDKAIRLGDASLQKQYVLGIRKWLKSQQVASVKQDDNSKILKRMGVDSYEAGFDKLWKIVCNLDLIVSKVTELQAIQFLKYDELFNGIAENTPKADKLLQNIGKGRFDPSYFHLSQIILERQLGLFEATAELKRGSSQALSSKGFAKTRNDGVDELVEQLRVQNNKLTNLLAEMSENQKKQADIQRQKQERALKETNQRKKSVSSSPQDFFNELEQKYKEQLQTLNAKLVKANSQIRQLQISSSQLQTRLNVAESQLSSQEFKQGEKPKSGSFEQALMEEMTKMKVGFERKIKAILEESERKEREIRKKEQEYKADNDKLKWQKNLLMKKFDSLPKQ